MLRSVILAFALLSCMVLAAVAAGVHYVSEYIRDHQYTVGELETAVYRFDASTDAGGPIEALATHVEMAAGVLQISPIAISPADSAYARVEIADNVVELTTTVAYRVDDGQGILTLLQAGSPGIPDVTGETEMVNEWRLQFGRSVPLSVTVEAGAGRLNLDLGGLTIDTFAVELGAGQLNLDLDGLTVNTLSVDVGAGEGVVDLRGAVPGDGRLELNNGIGTLALRLPLDVGVRMAAHSAIGNVDAPGLRYLEDEDVYVNAAYGPGEPAFDIDVSTGVGEVVVRSGDEPLPDDITDENLE